VFKFLELQEKIGFVDAVSISRQVRHADSRGGRRARITSPMPASARALLKVHERAADYLQAQLRTPAGARALRLLHERGLTAETIETWDWDTRRHRYEG
jgi:DNA primase